MVSPKRVQALLVVPVASPRFRLVGIVFSGVFWYDKGMDGLVTTLYSSPVREVLGQRTQYTHPNGMRTEYDYDNWNPFCSFRNCISERNFRQNCILLPRMKNASVLEMLPESEMQFQEQVRYEMQFRNEPLAPLCATTDTVLDSFEYTLNDGNEITRIDNADGSNWRKLAETRDSHLFILSKICIMCYSLLDILNSGSAEKQKREE